MANNVYGAIAADGGGTGALDSIDGSILIDGDVGFVCDYTDSVLLVYRLVAGSGAAEIVGEPYPTIVEPLLNAGTKRWILVGNAGQSLTLAKNNTYLTIFDESSPPSAIGTMKIDGSGHTHLNAKTGKTVLLTVNGVTIGTWSSSGLTLASGATVNEFSTDGTMAGNSDTAVPTEQAVVEYVDSVVGAGVSDYKNKIINGMFDIWQRNTTFSATGVSADRWAFTLANETGTVSRQPFLVGQTDVPDNPSWFARCAITTGGALAAAAAVLQQKIENVRQFSGQPVTVSFYAKASAGTPDISTEILEHFGTGGTPSADVTTIGVTTHTLSTSWQKFTVTATPTSISGKTMGTDLNSSYLSFVFWFSAGSDYNARTNSLGQQSITVDLAHVQLEFGSDATAFGVRHKQQELALCQRYYEKSYNEGVNPATVDNVGAWWWLSTGAIGSGTIIGWMPFQVQKRKTTAIVFYSPNTGTVAKAYNPNLAGDVTIEDGYPSATGINFQGGQASFTTAATQSIGVHWVADAEF